MTITVNFQLVLKQKENCKSLAESEGQMSIWIGYMELPR